MTPDQVIRHLRRANEVARRAMALGRHPFGAILIAPDGETVLAEQGNVDTVNHAESVLARTAATNFTPDYLAQCTLVTTVEPCAMCAGTQYWANIGRLVYGMTERRLLDLTGEPRREPHHGPALPHRAGRRAENHRRHRPGARSRARNRRAAPGFLEIIVKIALSQRGMVIVCYQLMSKPHCFRVPRGSSGMKQVQLPGNDVVIQPEHRPARG